MRMKKFLTFLLTIAMVASLLPATAFAANNTATTMRLAKAQGTVTVTNATGKKVTQTSNMKLYNGYKLKTGAKSYAWISLDDTKVAKLDASSVVSVQKTGQKLTLYLSSGNIFFNVKDPMKSGESLHIKTSTMTTGIRGTSGCVRVINPRVSEIHLLTGRIEVHAEHPEKELTKTEVLTAGHMATSLIDREAMQLTGEQVEIIVEELQEHNVCGNCATEVAADPALQERIEEETDLDAEEIVNDAEEKLEEDEQAAEEEQAAIEEAEAEQDMPEDVDPYFQEETASGGGGGGSVAEPANVITVTDWQEFVAAVATFHAGTEDTEIKLAADITPDDGEMTPEIYHDSAALTINLDEYGLYLPSTMINRSDLTITNADGFIRAYDTDTFSGIGAIIYNESAGKITHEDGDIIAPGFTAIYNDGTYINAGGTLIGEAGMAVCALENNKTAEFSAGVVEGTIQNEGELSISGGTFTAINTQPMITIGTSGELDIRGGTFTSEGILVQNNGGTFKMTGGTATLATERNVEWQVFAYYGEAGSTATVGGDAEINIDTPSINSVAQDLVGAFRLTDENDKLTMSGGSINLDSGYINGVYVDDGTFTMTDGTIIVKGNEAKGVLNNDTAELSGGTIMVQDTATDAIAVSTSGELKTDGNVSISASGKNTGVYASNGTLELADGRIRANGEAIAVVLRESGTTIVPNVIRPIKADISWGGSGSKKTIYENGEVVSATESINFSGDGKDHLIQPMLTMGDTQDPGPEKNENKGIDPETGREIVIEDILYEIYFTDMYGNSGGFEKTVSDAQGFLHAIQQFNQGADDSEIILTAPVTVTLADIEAYGDSRIKNTSSILTIDLAGNTLSLQNQLYVADRGSLKITDSASGGMVTGTIDPLISGEGTFELEDGTLETTGANAVKSVGDVIISGGVINVTQTNATGVSIGSGGSLSMTAGAINQTSTATYSKAIVLSNGSTAEVTGGSLNQEVGDSTGIMMGEEGGTAPELTFGGTARINVSDSGNGIVNNYGTVEMTGGTIQLNNVPSKGISSEEGTVEMTGGEIILVGSSNSSVNYGIYGNNTKITLDGGTIRESGDTTYSQNCAVYANGGKLALTSGAVSVNYGQGVYVSSVGIMTLGSAAVTGLEFEDLLVTGDNDETGYTYAGPDDSNYYTLTEEEGSSVTEYTVGSAEELVTAFEATENMAGPFSITLTNNISMENVTLEDNTVVAYGALTISPYVEVELDLNGKTLYLQKTLDNGGNLTITGNGNITNVSGETVTPLIQNNTNGTLVIDGATITNNTNSACTAVKTNGDTTLKKGTISTTAADSYSVEVTNNTFTMEGGTITSAGNTSNGVHVDSAEFVMESGTINVTGTGAAGVQTRSVSYVTMGGGEIIVAAGTNGYGIQQLTNSENLTMTNGTITVNSGYGVYTYGNANISGGAFAVAGGAVGIHNNGFGTVTVGDSVVFSGEGTPTQNV